MSHNTHSKSCFKSKFIFECLVIHLIYCMSSSLLVTLHIYNENNSKHAGFCIFACIFITYFFIILHYKLFSGKLANKSCFCDKSIRSGQMITFNVWGVSRKWTTKWSTRSHQHVVRKWNRARSFHNVITPKLRRLWLVVRSQTQTIMTDNLKFTAAVEMVHCVVCIALSRLTDMTRLMKNTSTYFSLSQVFVSGFLNCFLCCMFCVYCRLSVWSTHDLSVFMAQSNC